MSSGIFVRCEYMSGEGASIEERIRKAMDSTLDANSLATIAGTQWFLPANSRAAALAQPVTRADVLKLRKWRKSRLGPERYVHSMRLWNGQDPPRSANLAHHLEEPAASADIASVSLSSVDDLVEMGIQWQAVLEIGKRFAERLGGLALVSAHELTNQALAMGISESEPVGYAAFWGEDASGKNSSYRGLLAQGHRPPDEFIACASWDDVRSPKEERLRKLLELVRPQ